jgi:hypothetical protein
MGEYNFAILRASATLLELLDKSTDPTTTFRKLQKQLFDCCQANEDEEDEDDDARINLGDDEDGVRPISQLSTTTPRINPKPLRRNVDDLRKHRLEERKVGISGHSSSVPATLLRHLFSTLVQEQQLSLFNFARMIKRWDKLAKTSPC